MTLLLTTLIALSNPFVFPRSGPVPSRMFRVQHHAANVVLLQALDGRGAWCNGGFVITPKGVILIEAFKSPAAAREARRVIRRFTAAPVTHVVLTHHHFDHVGGTRAFGEATRIVAHERVTANLRRRNTTRSRLPNLTYTSRLLLSKSPRVELLHVGRGHTDGDTFIWLPDTGVLFSGDMAVHKDVGWFGNAHVGTWIASLTAVRKLPSRIVVPGHGPLGGPAVLRDFQGWLRFLQERIGALKRRGLSERAVLRRLKLPLPYATWKGATTRARGAITRTYREQSAPSR